MADEPFVSHLPAAGLFTVEHDRALEMLRRRGSAVAEDPEQERIFRDIAAAGFAKKEGNAYVYKGSMDKACPKDRPWTAPAAVVAVILFLVLLVRPLGSQETPTKAPSPRSTAKGPTPLLVNNSGEPCQPLSYSAGQSRKSSSNGLSYETRIPRPTVKGYYEPKVVPYPDGKPVFVNGYYRKDGTYVRPHFRSLPRR